MTEDRRQCKNLEATQLTSYCETGKKIKPTYLHLLYSSEVLSLLFHCTLLSLFGHLLCLSIFSTATLLILLTPKWIRLLEHPFSL